MYSEKLKQFKTTVSPEMINKIEGAGTEEALRKLIAKYHIHIDLAEEAFSALMLMCYGAMSSSECFNAVHSTGAVNDTDFVKFIQDVNEIVLKPLQNNVKAEALKENQNREAEYEKRLNNPIEENEEPIENFFESIGLNPDGTHKETVEETLARIDKEVDDEIEAEIKAEMEAEAKKQAEAEKQTTTDVKTNKQLVVQKEVSNFEHDIDLDNIPKSTASTYNFVEQNPEPENIIEEKEVENQLEPDIQDVTSLKNNSLDFIESRAAGNINLKPEPKTIEEKSKTYMKDPYHEEL